MRRLLKHLTITALLAAGVLLPAASAHAARHMEVALQDDQVFLNQSWYGRAKAFEKAKQLGVTRLRVNFIWGHEVASARSRHEPRHRAYNWYKFDSLIDEAAANGMRIEMTLTGPAPAWATHNHRIGVNRPNPRAYGHFVSDVAKHFKGRIDRYSIWNEPNWKSWLAPHNSAPHIYKLLYLAGYRAIRHADPRAKILIGETSPQARGRAGMAPLTFLRRMVGHSHLFADGYAHHPYDYSHSPSTRPRGRDDVTISTLGRLTHELYVLRKHRRLRTRHGGTLPLYLTEYGYMVRGRFRLSSHRQASYLRKAFSIAYHNPHVKSMLQYGLVSPPFAVNWDTSLLNSHGHARRTFYALRSWVRGAAVAKARTVLIPPAP
ncbi:MAG TPA: beta-galactosidase [Thermoleophilaceae bacterium]|nr:beta-galactosidase [Thermoleophilaceae bacterium]